MEDFKAEQDKFTKDFVSEFNEAKFQIYRLHILWLTCNTLSNSGKLKDWKWRLDTIWRELSPSTMIKDEGKPKEDTYAYQIKILNQNIAKCKDNNALYDALQEKEIYLRWVAEKIGKGGKMTSTEMEDFDE